MNIFCTSTSYIDSAKSLDDKRVIKMILESAQILSTAIYIHSNMRMDDIYKPTHSKHPCVVWSAYSHNNWLWLFNHMSALCKEYTIRYNKIHRSSQLMTKLLFYCQKYIPLGIQTPFVNCTRSKEHDINFQNVDNINIAYQKYLNMRWKYDIRKPTWTNTMPPKWCMNLFKKTHD